MSRKQNGQGRKCHYCRRIMAGKGAGGELEATRDHVIPKSRGGGRGTVWCCRRCNTMKGNMMPEKWYGQIASIPDFGPPLPMPDWVVPPPTSDKRSTLAEWIAEGKMPNAVAVLTKLGLWPPSGG